MASLVLRPATIPRALGAVARPSRGCPRSSVSSLWQSRSSSWSPSPLFIALRPFSVQTSSPPTHALLRRPFPLPQLHVGSDICHIGRIHAILDTPPPSSPSVFSSSPTRAARFIRRLLSPAELAVLGPLTTNALPSNAPTPRILAWLLSGGHPSSPTTSLHSHLWKAAQYLAGRFAAKEAAIKAHPHLPHKLTFHRVRIVRRNHHDTDNASGPPVALVLIHPSDGSAPYEQEAPLTISHDRDYATAVCLGFDDSA